MNTLNEVAQWCAVMLAFIFAWLSNANARDALDELEVWKRRYKSVKLFVDNLKGKGLVP